MKYDKKKLRELAERIYDLDERVYEQLESSLGRVFNDDRENCVNEMCKIMQKRYKGHVLRSDLALISNMARTIEDKAARKQIMIEYNDILTEVISLPSSFGGGDVLDEKMAELNAVNLKDRFAENDHLIICIGRTYGCGGSEIGFTLADTLKINYYDAEIFSEVLKRLEAEQDGVTDKGGFPYERDAADKRKYKYIPEVFKLRSGVPFKQRLKEFSRYHGLPKKDAIFFNQSSLLCDMAKKEDFIVMGRCADVILTNNHIPHVSIFINAPMEPRLRRVMEVNSKLNEKQARKLLKRLDKEHVGYYKFYTGREWGKAANYDLCINSASYGIKGSVDLILRMIDRA